MEHLHFEVSAGAGSIVSVDLNQCANVLLMDDINYHGYRNGSSFRYYGGYQRRTPARVVVPRTGHWHVAVDLGGASGYLSAKARLI